MVGEKGNRTFARFQIWLRRPMPKDMQANVPQYILQKYSDLTIKIPGQTITLVVGIDNGRAHLAKKIFDLYGFGTFDVKHKNWIPNKKYSPVHECGLKRCGFYQDKTCRIYRKYKPGGGCKDNPRDIWNWDKFASLTIFESPKNTSGYDFYWDRSKDRMAKNFGWFWKD